ncbi:MAG: hypothetical protein Q9204_004142 [Flavoplaca sp. TL-2023a]
MEKMTQLDKMLADTKVDALRLPYTNEENSVKFGQRLLPTLIDEIAQSDPKRLLGMMPRTAVPEDGFVDITYRGFATAVNACAWWLDAHLGRNANHQTIAYIGRLDMLYHIVTIAALKAGHTVWSTLPFD